MATRKASASKAKAITKSTSIPESFKLQRTRLRSYNWDLFFDGSVHVLTPGVDFTCSTLSMVQLSKQQARSRSVQIQIGQDELGRVAIKCLTPQIDSSERKRV